MLRAWLREPLLSFFVPSGLLSGSTLRPKRDGIRWIRFTTAQMPTPVA
jgi:hypothetical protein